ncbi:integral membrane sensor domain MASE1 [Lysobacter sp. HA18]
MSAAAHHRARIALQAVLWAALYVAGIWYSDVFVIGPSYVTLFWPAAGVAFAAVVGRGAYWAGIIPVAVVVAHATFAHVPVAFVPFSVASNLLGALAAAWVCNTSRYRHFDSANALFRFLSGAITMAVVAAAVGTSGLALTGMVKTAAVASAYTKWALGDLLGVLCIAPTVMLASQGRALAADAPDRRDYAASGEKVIWTVLYAASYAFVYWVGLQNSSYALGMVALPLALLLWSAFRFERLWTAIATLSSVFVITSLTGLGLAAFQAPRTLLDVILLLGFLNLFATLPLLLMVSIHAQRVDARRALLAAADAAARQQVELERLVAERTRQLDEANRQLEHASQTDALTGLRNRRYIAQQLPSDLGFYSREAAEAHTPPHALFFALVDIDHFKHINDTLGHRAGDEVLQQFSSLLSGLVRGSDYAIRWGRRRIPSRVAPDAERARFDDWRAHLPERRRARLPRHGQPAVQADVLRRVRRTESAGTADAGDVGADRRGRRRGAVLGEASRSQQLGRPASRCGPGPRVARDCMRRWCGDARAKQRRRSAVGIVAGFAGRSGRLRRLRSGGQGPASSNPCPAASGNASPHRSRPAVPPDR